MDEEAAFYNVLGELNAQNEEAPDEGILEVLTALGRHYNRLIENACEGDPELSWYIERRDLMRELYKKRIKKR